MRVVSLNLDVPDAAVVRRALAHAVATCGCQETERPPCADCRALGAVVSELEQCDRRPPRWRDHRPRPAVTAPLLGADRLASRAECEPRLYVLPGRRAET